MSFDTWSIDAKRVLDFLYRFWAAERRPPDVSDVYHGTGLGFRDIRRVYRELQEGFAIVTDDQRLNLNLQKVTPFSATPTPVSLHVQGAFHSYLGCPAESLTVGSMPMFVDDTITVRSSCSCCYESIELKIKGLDVVSSWPVEPIVLIVASPYEWEHGVPADCVCDSIRYVLDVEHARRYEHQVGRRGVIMTLAQLRELSSPIAKARMWDPHWPPIRVRGDSMVGAIEALGVDVGNWRLR